jgi:hypothetical protein
MGQKVEWKKRRMGQNVKWKKRRLVEKMLNGNKVEKHLEKSAHVHVHVHVPVRVRVHGHGHGQGHGRGHGHGQISPVQYSRIYYWVTAVYFYGSILLWILKYEIIVVQAYTQK